MADPTPTEVLAALSVVDGRLSILMNETIRLMSTCLPPAIDLLNTNLGLHIQQPADYLMAPEDVESDNYANNIMFSASARSEEQGARVYTDVVTLMIFDIVEPFRARRQITEAYDRAGLIRAVMFSTLGAQWIDPAGRMCWWDMRPLSRTALPGEWKTYSGVSLTYQAKQGPQGLTDNAWSV